jgi:hypothetical protein
MLKRHDNILTSRLETVSIAGCAHILWDELYLWYGIQRITVTIYRDLEARWQELTNDKQGALMKADGSGGLFLVAYNNTNLVIDE